jgi:hypothetical protein
MDSRIWEYSLFHSPATENPFFDVVIVAENIPFYVLSGLLNLFGFSIW